MAPPAPEFSTAPIASSQPAAGLPRVDVAVIGGSGLYSLFSADRSETVEIDTPYGRPSSPVTVGEIWGRRVAFLTRHGSDHSVPPHLIGYRANVWALASLGVTAIVSSSAVGGVHPDYAPGTFVVTDQFIDRTWGRVDTFYDAPGSVQHLAAADPFDPLLRRLAVEALTAEGVPFRSTGTCVVVQGPRFSTRAESLWYRAAGAHTVNMTMAPEVPLAAELGIGTVNLSFVTDSDAGLTPPEATPDAKADALADPASTTPTPSEPVTQDLVMSRLADAQTSIVAAIGRIVAAIPRDFTPRDLVARSAVEAVLARPTTAAPRPPA